MTIPPIQPPPINPPPPPRQPPIASTALSYATPGSQRIPGTGEYIPTADERSSAMLCWLLAILTGWIGPLIMWLIKKDQSRFVDFHGKQALFLSLGLIVSVLVLYFSCVGIILILPLAIVVIIFKIIALTKANAGEWYRCPLVAWMIH